MSFQQGLSGLNSSSKALDVISNNVANTSTVGFKQGTAQFADVYAASLTGSVSNLQVGLGSTVNAVRQAFSQGNLTSTNNPLDMAINGNGFFVVERLDGSSAYSRNGQFDIDKDGYIVTTVGERLMGYQSTDAAGIPTSGGTPVALNIPQGGIEPRATGAIDGVHVSANLDSREPSPADGTPPYPTLDINNPSTYNSTTSLKVFDSLGNDHTLTLYFVKSPSSAPANSWVAYGSLDGEVPSATNQVSMTFNEFGLPPATTVLNFSSPVTTGATSPFAFSIDMSRSTQFGSSFAVTELTQDGYAPGEVAGLSVSRDGLVEGRYTNGQTKVLGQVVLATFRNPNGLTSLGNNLWAASPASGAPIPGKPGSGLNGIISSGMVEESNVELTQELVQMIIQQRNYQANAQSIKTQDSILQTLVNLR
ncbi:MAG: flagellar hook protein FlgE [Thauera sp.]|nr:flagellar hook protein FlgE [Thauera sp.]